MDSMKRMKELIPLLTQASRAYYQEDRELMSNYEYDKLYDELVKLEAETGITLAGSPTTMVGYEALEELPKEAHEKPMLSLDNNYIYMNNIISHIRNTIIIIYNSYYNFVCNI